MDNTVIKKEQDMMCHKITMDNRNKISITGITKMVSSNDTLITMLIKNTKLVVSGKELHIEKLDIEGGELQACGVIDSIKYAGGDGFIKRIFK